MQVHYLEIVTPDVDATREALAKLHGVSFGEPEPVLGNARTAALHGGGRIGVRAPMHDGESPVVGPYVLVKDIESAVEAAKAAGGEIALPPTEIPDRGRFAIYLPRRQSSTASGSCEMLEREWYARRDSNARPSV